jgi:hypothetical protein
MLKNKWLKWSAVLTGMTFAVVPGCDASTLQGFLQQIVGALGITLPT